jgi:hypothetical protein
MRCFGGNIDKDYVRDSILMCLEMEHDLYRSNISTWRISMNLKMWDDRELKIQLILVEAEIRRQALDGGSYASAKLQQTVRSDKQEYFNYLHGFLKLQRKQGRRRRSKPR